MEVTMTIAGKAPVKFNAVEFYKDCIERVLSVYKKAEEDYNNGRGLGLIRSDYLKKVLPPLITFTCDAGQVSYKVRDRSGTVCVNESGNTMPDSFIRQAGEAYLTCVDPERNAYKFYHMLPSGNSLTVKYGRMGVEKGQLFGERSCTFDLSMYWPKYMEKIAKGYIDRTDVFLDSRLKEPEKKKKATASAADKSPAGELFRLLLSWSKKAVEEAKVAVPLNAAILKASAECIARMRAADTVEAFNKALLENIAILQRPVATGNGSGVKRLMASSKAEFPGILQREEDLLDAMGGVVAGSIRDGSHFDAMGIEVYAATEKQTAQVMDRLSDELKGKVDKVYRVIPKAQKERFDSYLKKNHIRTVKQFWHGTRNENMLSIMEHSLMLRPNAVITGKMFGDGIYFAPSSMKSWGYTSFRGTRWARGGSNQAVMGLFATAYGVPKEVDVWQSGVTYNKAFLEGKNCLHAKAGVSLRNDEVIFYDEAAMLLQYVVIFKG